MNLNLIHGFYVTPSHWPNMSLGSRRVRNTALEGCGWWASRPGSFNLEERANCVHWRGDRVGSRAVLDDLEKSYNSFPIRDPNLSIL